VSSARLVHVGEDLSLRYPRSVGESPQRCVFPARLCLLDDRAPSSGSVLTTSSRELWVVPILTVGGGASVALSSRQWLQATARALAAGPPVKIPTANVDGTTGGHQYRQVQ